jgi:hypothetical protein
VEEPRPTNRKMRSYTLVALLGVFVGAAVLAIVTRALPGRMSRLMRPPTARERGSESGDDRGR